MTHRETYKKFERGTPAGNLCFNLYHKKNMDSTLDPDLLARIQQMRAEREATEKPKAKPIPKSKVEVTVPKFGQPKGPTSEQIANWKMKMAGSKKKITTIREEEKEYNQLHPVQAPEPTRPLITEGDKVKLQQVMEFGYALAPQNPNKGSGEGGDEGLSEKQKMRRKTNERDQQRFDEILTEVADRKKFLKEMHETRMVNGKAVLVCGHMDPAERKGVEQKMLAEIADRIDEMKQLDDRLRKRPATGMSEF